MYCSSCGAAVPLNLTYCNRCGAKVPRGEDQSKAVEFSQSLVFAIVGVFVLGVSVTIGLMAVMRQVVGFDLSLILAVTMICFTLIIFLEAMLIWLLFKSLRIAKETGQAQLKENTTKELAEAQPRVLPEHMPSVTEHTTRAFEPIYEERK